MKRSQDHSPLPVKAWVLSNLTKVRIAETTFFLSQPAKHEECSRDSHDDRWDAASVAIFGVEQENIR